MYSLGQDAKTIYKNYNSKYIYASDGIWPIKKKENATKKPPSTETPT